MERLIKDSLSAQCRPADLGTICAWTSLDRGVVGAMLEHLMKKGKVLAKKCGSTELFWSSKIATRVEVEKSPKEIVREAEDVEKRAVAAKKLAAKLQGEPLDVQKEIEETKRILVKTKMPMTSVDNKTMNTAKAQLKAMRLAFNTRKRGYDEAISTLSDCFEDRNFRQKLIDDDYLSE